MLKKIMSGLLATLMLTMVLSGCTSKPKVEEIQIGSGADLVGKKIGVQQGTTGNILANDIADAVVSEYKKPIDAAMELKNGKLDAVVIDAMPAKKIVENMEGLVILDEELSVEEYAIAVKKDSKELLDSINATLAKLKKEGTIETLYDIYITEEKEKSESPIVVSETNFPQTIVMGTNPEFAPFEYLGEDGQTVEGYDVEIATAIANEMGKNLKIDSMAFDSLIIALTSGKIDFVAAGMTATEDRKKNVDFSDSYFNASQVIIVRENSVKK